MSLKKSGSREALLCFGYNDQKILIIMHILNTSILRRIIYTSFRITRKGEKSRPRPCHHDISSATSRRRRVRGSVRPDFVGDVSDVATYDDVK